MGGCACMKVNHIKIKSITREETKYPGDDEKEFEKFKEEIRLYKPTFVSSSELCESLESNIFLKSPKNSSFISEMK